MRKKKNILTVVSLALLVAATVLFYRYGWQYTGFKMVTHPNYLIIEKVEEQDKDIVILGKTALNIGSYAGSVLEFKDGVLYVGVRFSLFGDETGFRIKYPQDAGIVHRVVLKKNETDKTIWIRPWEGNARQ